MVSCREFVGLFLDGWLAGELPQRRRRECDEHAQGCASCARYAASYRAVVELARRGRGQDDAPPLPEALVQSILRSID